MLDYKLLEAMAGVIQEGGFDKAARKLCLTQSAVSQRIRLLEEQTGQILVARTSPPRPTAAGQRMLKHYLRVRRLEDDLSDFLAPAESDAFVSIPVGINADSLATWFTDAVRPFLEQTRVLLDLRTDDQEQTHRFLRDGEVLGCVSVQEAPIQGCHVAYLGCMTYRLVSTPDFAARWFPHGLSVEAVRCAPSVIFNRKDELHNKLFRQALGKVPPEIPAHYVPSSEQFSDFIFSGFAYGMLPDQQNADLVRSGKLTNLAPLCQVCVKLYWHCWNLRSEILEKFTRILVSRAQVLLGD